MLKSIQSARLSLRRGRIAKDLLVIVILVSIVLAFLWPSLFLEKTLLPVDILLRFPPWSYYSDQPPVWNGVPSDAVLNFYPWKLFSVRALESGTLPLWNPYQMSGTPFVANSQAGLFYPFHFLFILLPPFRAYALFIALHLLLAGLFMYAFLRTVSASRVGSLIGGIAFMSSPFLIGWSEHLPHLSVMVWLPLIFILLDRMLERRSIFYAAALGFVLGVQLLGGMFQFSFFVFLASFLYFLFRAAMLLKAQPSLRRGSLYLVLMSVAMALGLSLAAVQLLPSLEMAQFIVRAGQKHPTGHFFMPGAMSFSYLITLLEPNFLGPQSDLHPLGSRLIVESAYVGVFPLLAALVSLFNLRNRHSLFFLLLAFVAVCLALGTPAYRLFFLIPKFTTFRGPVRFLYLEVFALSVLSGLGFDHLVHLVRERQALPSPWALAIVWLTPLIGVILLANRVATGSVGIFPGTAPPWPYVVRQTVILFCLFSASLTVLISFLQRRMNFYMFAGLALLVTTMDVVGQNRWFFPALDYDKAYLSTASTDFLQENIGLYRVARYGTGFLESPLPPNTGMIYGLSDIQGKDVFILRDYVDFLNLIEDHREKPLWIWNRLPNFEESESLGSKLIDLLNVKYVLATEPFEDPKYELVFDGSGGDILIYENKEVLPRAFIVHRVEMVLEKEEVLARLKSDSYDPSLVAIISEELSPEERSVNERAPLSDSSEAHILDYGLNTISIEASMENPGFLVLADLYYPGWKVFVDGQERKIYRADHIFRSVYLEAGEHEVKILFDPLSFKLGLCLGLLALLFSTGISGYSLFHHLRVRISQERRSEEGGSSPPAEGEVEEYVVCDLCGCDDTRVLFEKYDRQMVKCQVCGLVYTNPRWTLNHLLRIRYTTEYFEKEYIPTHAELRRQARDRLRTIRRLKPKAGRLLDIGCGTGIFLASARKEGWDVVGIELSDYAANYARRKMKLPVITGTLADAKLDNDSFDLVTLWDVIEHLHNPGEVLTRIHYLLKVDGLVALSTPNFRSLAANLLGKRWSFVGPGEHIYLFTPETLHRMLSWTGFEVIEMQTPHINIEEIRDTLNNDELVAELIRSIETTYDERLAHLQGDEIIALARKVALSDQVSS